jgi:hypothetical protein
MRKSLTALSVATTIAVAAAVTPTTADAARGRGARIPITDTATAMGRITPIQSTTTAATDRRLTATITYTCRDLIIAYGGLITATERLLV